MTGPNRPAGRSYHHQQGYLLITVVVTLFLVASIAMLLTRDSALSANTSSRELDAVRADFVAQAAMRHALWRVASSSCVADIAIPEVAIGTDRYSASTTGAAATTSYVINVDQDAWIRSDDVTQVNGTGVDQHIRFESGKIEQALYRFDVSSIPANANVYSAEAWFFIEVGKEHPEGAIGVFENNASWTEANATWDKLGDLSSSARIATIPAQPAGGVWISFNMSSQVQSWVNGGANNGVVLASSAEGVHAEYASREAAAGERPYIKVVVGAGPPASVSVQAVGTTSMGTSRNLAYNDVAPSQAATTIVLPIGTGGKDGWVDSTRKNDNFGTTGEMTISGGTNPKHFLAEFALDGIPKGSRIVSARLEMHLNYMGSADPNGAFSVHRMTEPWTEGTGDYWNPGDGASWNKSNGVSSWSFASNHDATSAVAMTTVNPGYTGRHTWEITSLVQDWVSGNYPNYGLLLKGNASAVDAWFHSSDNSNASNRPSLTIEYACQCGRVCQAPQGNGKIALFVDSSSTPGAHDKSKKQLFEAWGYDVSFIDDDTLSLIIGILAPGYDAIYVSESVDPNKIGSKLNGLPNGIVNEEGLLTTQFGIASGYVLQVGHSINVLDASHYITSVFPSGSVDFFDADMEGMTTSGDSAGARRLADWGSGGAVVVLEAGAETVGGGSSAGRRVSVPFGRTSKINLDYVNASGGLLMQRAIAWAMGANGGDIGSVLMVVGNDGNLTSQEVAKKNLFESWSYAVNLVDEDDSQGNFNSALAGADVVFVGEDVNAADVGTKLTAATIGVVIEEDNLTDELGLSSSIAWESGTTLNIDSTNHYITETFAPGPLTVFSSTESLARLNGSLAPDLRRLASLDSEPVLVALDQGATTYTGGSAAGPRVMLPWGGNDMDVNNLNADGLTIFRRALEWAMNPVAAENGPVAHWKLDETSGLTALESIGGHDGTLRNGPGWSTGQVDGALVFDGSNDYVSVPHDDALSLTGPMTFTAWINASSFSSGYHTILAKDDLGPASNFWFGLWLRDLTFGFYAGGTFREVFAEDLDLVSGSWYHVAASFDDTDGDVHIYLDGILVHDEVLGFSPTTIDADVYIGRSVDGEHWQGSLDDVRIYDRVLTVEEVADLAAREPSGPFAHWKLDESSGTTAADSVGGHDGTLVNGPSWAAGQVDGGLYFDGSNDYIDVSSMNPISYDDFTVSAWYKSAESGVDDDEYIFEHNDNFENEITFGPTDDGTDDRLRFGFAHGGSGTWDPHYGTSDIVDQQWHHVVGVRSAGRIKLYVDGIEESDGVDAQAGETVFIDGDGPFIGDLPDNTERVHGTLDDVRLYDYALTAAEILELFTVGGGGGGSCAGTYRDEFNAENYGGNDGTLTWATNWLEHNENDGPTSGDESVDDNDSDFHLQVRDNDGGGEGVEREADLSGYANATFTFEYRRNGFDNNNDYVTIQVSSNGGSTWNDLENIGGNGTDTTYVSKSYDISAFMATDTRIRFLTSSNLGSGDEMYIDNVQIAVTGCTAN